jgi:hypothetical protein
MTIEASLQENHCLRKYKDMLGFLNGCGPNRLESEPPTANQKIKGNQMNAPYYNSIDKKYTLQLAYGLCSYYAFLRCDVRSMVNVALPGGRILISTLRNVDLQQDDLKFRPVIVKVQPDVLLLLLDTIKSTRVHIKTKRGKLLSLLNNIKSTRVSIKIKQYVLLFLLNNIKSAPDHIKIKQDILLSSLDTIKTTPDHLLSFLDIIKVLQHHSLFWPNHLDCNRAIKQPGPDRKGRSKSENPAWRR